MYQLIIVDDEPITRNALKNFVEKNCPSYTVAGTFPDGKEALDFLLAHPVDIVITDIRMPVMDGLSLCREIHERFLSCIMIIISGYGDFEYAKKAIHYGVANYLLKPLDFEELLDFLKSSREKLDLTHQAADTSFEDMELFFTDIIMGNLKEKKALEQRFGELSLPVSLEATPGALLCLELAREMLPSWKYGREQLPIAVLNSLCMSLTDYKIYPVLKTGCCFYFILFNTSSDIPMPAPECLEEAVSSNLKLSCRAAFRCSFQSLVEFAGRRSSEPLLPAISLQKDLKEEAESEDVVIKKAKDYIHANYAMDLTREDVANAVFLSSAYFSRFFKQKTGLSFFDYLTSVRMQKAIELLGTNMKINDIAKKVGYQSRNRFFINFRQYTSYNPTEYRRHILKMENFYEDSEDSHEEA